MLEEADTRSPSGQRHEEQTREALLRVNQDLEERVRERTALYELANAALQESEQRLRTVIGNAPIVLFALDSEGVFTLAEGKALDDLGMAQDELLGCSVFDMFASQPEVLESVRTALAGEPATAIVGANPAFEARFSPVRNENGDVTGVIGVATDITERRQADEAQQRYVSLIENSPDFIGMSTLDGQVTFVNEAGRELVGLNSLEDAQSRTMYEFLMEDDLSAFERQILPEVMETGRWQGEFRLRHFTSGAGIPIDFNVFTISCDKTGEPIGFATVSRDITEQKCVEQALRDAADHDPLTGLLNRRAGNAAIEERLATAQSNNMTFAMMVLDLDRFKSINDSFGHETGDVALVQFADVLSNLVGESGVVCRIGGDEFGIGMEDVDVDHAFSFARRVQTSLRRALASSDTELRPQFTVSIGIACYPDDGDDASLLSRRADRAMYEAKVAGCDTSRAWRQIDSSQAA